MGLLHVKRQKPVGILVNGNQPSKYYVQFSCMDNAYIQFRIELVMYTFKSIIKQKYSELLLILLKIYYIYVDRINNCAVSQLVWELTSVMLILKYTMIYKMPFENRKQILISNEVVLYVKYNIIDIIQIDICIFFDKLVCQVDLIIFIIFKYKIIWSTALSYGRHDLR